MTTRQLRSISKDAYGVTYADPVDPDFRIRFKNSTVGKNLNGVHTTNHISEVIVSDVSAVDLGGVAANDTISIRVRISGALESNERKIALVKSIAAQLDVWVDEHILTGFPPETLPVVPITGTP